MITPMRARSTPRHDRFERETGLGLPDRQVAWHRRSRLVPPPLEGCVWQLLGFSIRLILTSTSCVHRRWHKDPDNEGRNTEHEWAAVPRWSCDPDLDLVLPGCLYILVISVAVIHARTILSSRRYSTYPAILAAVYTTVECVHLRQSSLPTIPLKGKVEPPPLRIS